MKLCACALAALLCPVFASSADEQEAVKPAPSSESWRSTTLEAVSVLGEAYYEKKDFSEAKQQFHNSLESSTRLGQPRPGLVAMDLYRAAELEVREGDYPAAKRHLDILLSRYPDTQWAQRAEQLLLTSIPQGTPEPGEGEPVGILPAAVPPEHYLKKIQDALKEDRSEEALNACRDFEERFPKSPELEEIRLAEGALLLRLEDPAAAASVLEPLLAGARSEPVKSKARYLLGDAYLLSGNVLALQRAVPEADPRKTEDPWLALAQAWRADSPGRLEAVLALDRRSPASAYAAAFLASDLDGRGRVKEAAKVMSRAAQEADLLDIGSLGAHARISMGHLFYRERRYRESAAAYEDFLKRYPSDPRAPDALYQEALDLKWTGDWRASALAFERLTRDYADSKETSAAYLQLGQIYSDHGLTGRAVASYESMKKAADAAGGKEAQLLIAQVHYNHKRYREAIPIYLKYLKDNPDDPRAYQIQEVLLSSYWLGARDDPGLVAAAESYPRHPIVARIRWDFGARAMRAKDYVRAERQFRLIAQDFPRSGFAAGSLFYQAECLMKMQDAAAAEAAYLRAAEQFPRSPYARQSYFKLGLSRYAAGDYAKAAEAFSWAGGGRDALAADAQFNKALALDKAGRAADAADAYRLTAVRFPSYSKASWSWLQAGKIWESAGRLDSAVRAYSRVGPADRAEALLGIGLCDEKLHKRALARRAYEALRASTPSGNPYRLHGLLRLALMTEIKSPRKAGSMYRQVLRLTKDEALQAIARRRLAAITSPKE